MPDNPGNDKTVSDQVGHKDHCTHPSDSIGYIFTLTAFRSERVRPDFEHPLSSAHAANSVRSQFTDIFN